MSDNPTIYDYDDEAFALAARDGAIAILEHAGALIEFEPGDGTLYQVAIIRKSAGRFLVGTNFDPLYPWNGGQIHWDYAIEKWGDRGRNKPTGYVIGRLLCELAVELHVRTHIEVHHVTMPGT